ncbi:MAG: hypothetical protein GX025_08000 [Clostridiales bacterium]|jgi:two-component system response regulator (stage 0 sporulation protein A)|nr:hypothetical protein [Clostridiales bacterium]
MTQTEPCIIEFDNIVGKQSQAVLPASSNPSSFEAYTASLGMSEGYEAQERRNKTAMAAKAHTYEVEKLIIELGVPPHIKGFLYIRDAILMLFEDEMKIHGVTKIMYPEIAKEYGTTGVRVERAIRHAIDLSWSRSELGSLRGLFPYHDRKPSNTEFLAFLSHTIAQKLFS